jgi:hypothetical protein
VFVDVILIGVDFLFFSASGSAQFLKTLALDNNGFQLASLTYTHQNLIHDIKLHNKLHLKLSSQAV